MLKSSLLLCVREFNGQAKWSELKKCIFFSSFLIYFLFSIFLQLQGPSVSGLPINPPGSQVTKSAEQPGLTRTHKQPVRQVSSLVGPSLRNPAGVQDGTKSAAKVGLQSREPKAKSAATKQTKISAWR